MLSDVETAQNASIVDEMLGRLLPNMTEQEKQSFLAQCNQHVIWLPGISPFVRKQFIEASTQLQNQQPGRAERLFQALFAAEEQERQFLQQQFLHNSNAVVRQNQGFEAHTSPDLEQLITRHQPTERYGWLKEGDVVNALMPLANDPKVYVHMPVSEIDQTTRDTVEAELHAGAKLAFVPQVKDNGAHWTITSYQLDRQGRLQNHYFNPRGDGLCGDRAVAHAYERTLHVLNKDFGIRHGAEASAQAVRQQTIRLIQSVVARSQPTLSAQPRPVVAPAATPELTPTPRPTMQPRPAPRRLMIKEELNTLTQLYNMWNRDLDRFLEKSSTLSDTQRAAQWDEFTKTAEQQFAVQQSQATYTQTYPGLTLFDKTPRPAPAQVASRDENTATSAKQVSHK